MNELNPNAAQVANQPQGHIASEPQSNSANQLQSQTPAPGTAQDETESKMELLKSAILSGNVPQLVLYIISLALEMRASDIHIEPLENTIRMRLRVDGVLQPIVEYPPNMHAAVVSRIKIMSNLKIDEQRIPQDGRTNVTTKDNKEMDLRVSTVPTVNGEKIVMRLQDKSRRIPTLNDLGITGNNLKYIERALKMPNGIILTSGPTGSGKTTTLYSCLTMLNKPGVNIFTIEDPVEIQMDGLNQSQVKPDIGYTFATGLRASLRQDPDIMMVGEIRDHETINVAIECSLTGHLVLSTIHTNSATETLTRILNMDVPAYLIAATIDTIIAQRLVRVLCPKCKAVHEPAPEIKDLAVKAIAQISDEEKANHPNLNFAAPVFYAPVGCDDCGGIGYKGRTGLYEIMPFTGKLKNAVLNGMNHMDIEKLAIEEGMITLEHSGVINALQGVTSLDEVYRVANINF